MEVDIQSSIIEVDERAAIRLAHRLIESARNHNLLAINPLRLAYIIENNFNDLVVNIEETVVGLTYRLIDAGDNLNAIVAILEQAEDESLLEVLLKSKHNSETMIARLVKQACIFDNQDSETLPGQKILLLRIKEAVERERNRIGLRRESDFFNERIMEEKENLNNDTLIHIAIRSYIYHEERDEQGVGEEELLARIENLQLYTNRQVEIEDSRRRLEAIRASNIRKFTNFKNFLLELSDKINAGPENNEGQNYLHLAAEREYTRLIMFIICNYGYNFVGENEVLSNIDDSNIYEFSLYEILNARNFFYFDEEKEHGGSSMIPFIDQKDNKDNTYLHIAVLNNNFELAKLLLACGASYNGFSVNYRSWEPVEDSRDDIVNQKGQTPEDIAKDNNDTQIINLFRLVDIFHTYAQTALQHKIDYFSLEYLHRRRDLRFKDFPYDIAYKALDDVPRRANARLINSLHSFFSPSQPNLRNFQKLISQPLRQLETSLFNELMIKLQYFSTTFADLFLSELLSRIKQIECLHIIFDVFKFKFLPEDSSSIYHALAEALPPVPEQPPVQSNNLREILNGYLENNRESFANYFQMRPLQRRINEHVESQKNGVGFLASRPILDEYIAAINDEQPWTANIQIELLSQLLNRPLIVINSQGEMSNLESTRYIGDPVFIYYHGNNHYDALLINQERVAYTPRLALAKLMGTLEEEPVTHRQRLRH